MLSGHRYVDALAKTELLVDVRGRRIESLTDFREALVSVNPEALGYWKGRSLDALWDIIENRGFSNLLDSHDVLVVHADHSEFLSPENQVGAALLELFESATHARLELF
ncbi:barstar family protein [Kitasatospora sp. NPDC001175]|uniref:barstar family protein n=1 Tax=Kitasatospora sp. NPDC001175 TaxID=3157103 RepID=UPI003CFF389A